jgi:hypothetical protein
VRDIVEDFADAFMAVDAAGPVGEGRKGRVYQPGVGPLGERSALRLVVTELSRSRPEVYGIAQLEAPYPGQTRSKCDVLVPGEWAIEAKMLRPFGDNGKPDDTWLKELLSPYPHDRGVVGDLVKLADSQFAESRMVLVYGFECRTAQPKVDITIAIDVFEAEVRWALGERLGVAIGERYQTRRSPLIHPVHTDLVVWAWEVRRVK